LIVLYNKYKDLLPGPIVSGLNAVQVHSFYSYLYVVRLFTYVF